MNKMTGGGEQILIDLSKNITKNNDSSTFVGENELKFLSKRFKLKGYKVHMWVDFV